MSALTGLRIVELAEGVAGEYCGKLLSDFGADVIKIERPDGGSPTRSLPPFGSGEAANESVLFAYLNTNKSSVTLDLEQEEGRAMLARLLDKADAVVDDHAPGWLAAHGLDPATMLDTRPDLILTTITPYGQTSPRAHVPAEDLSVFSSGGWGHHTPSASDPNRPPLKGAGRFLVSYESALDAAMCTAAALFAKSGRVIDVSKQRVMASRLDYVLAQMIIGDMDVSESRTAYDLGGPASIVPCKDGFIYIWASDAQMWRGMKQLMGFPAWMEEDFPEDWLQKACTPDRVARTRAGLAEFLKTQEKHAVSAEAQRLGIMMVPVNNPDDLVVSPQFRHRGFFQQVTHPTLGTASYPTVPYKMSRTPARITRPAPQLGEQSEDIWDALERAPGKNMEIAG